MFFSSVFAFGEGLGLKFGIDVAASVVLKPYAGVDVCPEFSLNESISFGVGGKLYGNLIHGDSEAYISGGPYVLLSYKYLNLGAGCFFDKTLNPLSLYAFIGGTIPVWELKKGKLGIDFGLEFWGTEITKSLLFDEKQSKGSDSDGSFSSAAGFLNAPKVFLGVSYFLPL